jgi:AraC-like DNA-binding protein
MTSQADDNSVFRFSLDDASDPDEIEAWHEDIGRGIFRLDFSRIADGPSYSEGAVRLLPGIAIASLASTGIRIARTPDLVGDGNDDVGFLVCTAGSVQISQHARQIVLMPGDAVLTTNGESGFIDKSLFARLECFCFPRGVLAPLVPDIEDALMRPIAPDSEALRLLTSYGKSLLTDTMTGTELLRLAASHMRELAALALGGIRSTGPLARFPSIAAARLQAIKATVMERLGQHDLAITGIAAAHGISPRYVQRLFELEGTTFSRFVLSQRLESAHRKLTDQRNLGRPISSIAFEVGFGDLSYFNHAFRRLFGATPSDVKANAFKDSIDSRK